MNLKSFDIIGYTYKAELLCPGCTLQAVKAEHPLDYPIASTIQANDTAEDILRTVAKSMQLDNTDESSYDSDEFPKVVFVDMVNDIDSHESCGRCGGHLL